MLNIVLQNVVMLGIEAPFKGKFLFILFLFGYYLIIITLNPFG